MIWIVCGSPLPADKCHANAMEMKNAVLLRGTKWKLRIKINSQLLTGPFHLICGYLWAIWLRWEIKMIANTN